MRRKLDAYREIRPEYQYVSMRNRRHDFITDEVEHPIALEAVVQSISEKSDACKKTAGLQILWIIRDILKNHAKETRINADHSKIQHRFYNLMEKSDLHAESCYKSKIRHQKAFMQTVAAEIEAQSLIFYLERRNVARRTLAENDKLPLTHALFKLDPKAEKALNDLRMIFLS